MYKLYRKPNGQIEQVPINNNDDLFNDLENLDPMEAKGSDLVRPEFLAQEERQFDLIKQNETQQAQFQSKQLNFNDLQVFNATFTDSSWSTNASYIRKQYNDTETTGNLSDSIGFNDGFGTYYNIVNIEVNLYNTVNNNVRLGEDSYVQFYLCQNDGTASTLNTGQKIPRQTSLNADGGTVTWTTGGPKQSYQYVSVPLTGTSQMVPSNSLGLSSSGLALKTVFLQSTAIEDWTTMRLELMVYVDIKSARTTL